MIFGIAAIVSGVFLFFCPPFDPTYWKKETPPENEETEKLIERESEKGEEHKVNDPSERIAAENTKLLGQGRYWLLVSTGTLYLMLYITLEATFGNYISDYAYKSHYANLEDSSYVSSGLFLYFYSFLDSKTITFFFISQFYGVGFVLEDVFQFFFLLVSHQE